MKFVQAEENLFVKLVLEELKSKSNTPGMKEQLHSILGIFLA